MKTVKNRQNIKLVKPNTGTPTKPPDLASELSDLDQWVVVGTKGRDLVLACHDPELSELEMYLILRFCLRKIENHILEDMESEFTGD